jgi:hypothetical protein
MSSALVHTYGYRCDAKTDCNGLRIRVYVTAITYKRLPASSKFTPVLLRIPIDFTYDIFTHCTILIAGMREILTQNL